MSDRDTQRLVTISDVDRDGTKRAVIATSDPAIIREVERVMAHGVKRRRSGAVREGVDGELRSLGSEEEG